MYPRLQILSKANKYILGSGPGRRLYKLEEDLYIIMAEAHTPGNYFTKVRFYAAFLTPEFLCFFNKIFERKNPILAP